MSLFHIAMIPQIRPLSNVSTYLAVYLQAQKYYAYQRTILD